MRRILLFAYGTLLDGRTQRRVFGREMKARPARLAGWRVTPRAVGRRFPGVVCASQAEAAGGVLALRRGELAKADAYEDAPRLYRRRRLTVLVGRHARRCWVYVPSAGDGPGLAGEPPRDLAV